MPSIETYRKHAKLLVRWHRERNYSIGEKLRLLERYRGPTLGGAVPILFVRDVTAAAAFYEATLGFHVDFLHGKPPFYGSVSRDRARLHLRFVHQTNFTELAAREGGLILATIEVANVKALFQEYEARGVDFAQRPVIQAWGGLDFHVRDPDGNVISFVQYRRPTVG
jgi:catechol 2,3-dioxygenase-like lactoylglutathione lyase family enzyme